MHVDLRECDSVAVADGGEHQGKRGIVVAFVDSPAGRGCGVKIRLDESGEIVTVEWWKDVQLIKEGPR